MDSVWLPAVVPVIIESYVWTLWLYESFLQIALYDRMTMSEMTDSNRESPTFQSTCHRVPKQPDQVEDKQLHLPPRASHRSDTRASSGAKVRHLRGDFIKVMECSDKDHVGFLDIRSFVYLRQCSNSSYIFQVCWYYVIGPRETLKLYILANIPPSLKPKGDERWNSERWLRAHIVTLSQVLAVATEESFFSTRRIFSAGNVWAETNFRRLTSNQGDFCVAQKENIDILEYALKGKHSNRTRDC